MAIITLPNLNRWSTARWGFIKGDSVITTMNGNEQIIKGPPAKRLYQISLVELNGDDRTAWQLALEQLSSLENTFIAAPPDFVAPLSGYSGPNPLVVGGSQLGVSVNVDSASNSTLLLKAGDYFAVNSELKRATADVTSSGTGTATIPFTPPFRTSPLDNAVVNITAPTINMRLIASETTIGFDAVLNGLTGINAIETWS